MSDEKTPAGAAEPTAPNNLSSDDLVEARWDITVIPNDAVSIHYTVSPKSADDAITSVSASFALMENHVVLHNYAGSSTQDLIAPRPGQGATGDMGVDVSVFGDHDKKALVGILAGTVRHGEEVQGFFFSRSFDPSEVDSGSDES